MDAALKNARMQIASEIGADIGSFTPPDEKRFTGVELMIGIGGSMLYSFFKGMAKKIAEKAGEKAGEKIGEKLGESFADWLIEKYDDLTGKDKATQEQSLEHAHDELKTEIGNAGLTPQQVSAIAQALEPALIKALSVTAPEEVSERIAHTVRLAAVQTL